MSPCFVLGRENVPCVAEVVNRSLKADCTDFIKMPTKLCHCLLYLKNGGKLSFNVFGKLEDGGHVNATKTFRDLYQLICMISKLKLLKR